MLTREILMELITVATQSTLVLTVILVGAWLLMERAEVRRAEREEQAQGAIRFVPGLGANGMPAYRHEAGGNL